MDANSSNAFNEAFVVALTESQTAIRAYCEAALGPSEEAKDAWQRTNVVLWRKASSWDPKTRFLSWALAIARYEVLAAVRDRQRERLVFDADVVEMMAESALPAAHAQPARHAALEACLQKLGERARSILTGHYVTGHSQAELADKLGMKEATLRVLLLRIRRSLGECIEHQLNREAAS